MFHTLPTDIASGFCFYNPTNNFNIYSWNRVSLCGQPSYKVVNILHKMLPPCDNLVITLQCCSKATSKFPYGLYIINAHFLSLAIRGCVVDEDCATVSIVHSCLCICDPA